MPRRRGFLGAPPYMVGSSAHGRSGGIKASLSAREASVILLHLLKEIGIAC